MEIGFLDSNAIFLCILCPDNILLVLRDSSKLYEIFDSLTDPYVLQGKGKSTKEVLRRIDYGGILALLLTVMLCSDAASFFFDFSQIDRINSHLSQLTL